ncbi:EF-P beta-lysylation protein EpmB, partial [Methylomagnum sp.]
MLTKPAMLPRWQAELADSFTDPAALLEFLALDPHDFPALRHAAASFPFRVTRAYAARIRQRDPADPLLRQVLPLAAELAEQPGFVADPVGDLHAAAAPGVLHKYQGRVLLIATGACAIHCRYCFRREFPYESQGLGKSREREALDVIAADPSIREVILSGGDPLVLNDERLARWVDGIAAIPQVERLRLHTRLPVVLPSRITPELVACLAGSRLRAVMVIHANHPAEFDAAVGDALARLRGVGITLLNQAVLLRGVNDDAATLARLSEALFEQGVLPYYLHLLDKARGTGHFEVAEARAL